MTIATHHAVDDLPPDQRRTLETLLGQKLQTEQYVFILACTPGVSPDENVRQAAHDRIEATLSRAHRHSTAQGVTADQADDILNEAMDNVRRRA